MEHIGILKEAGHKAKQSGDGTVFKIKVDSFEYTLFNPADQKFANEHLLKRVKVTYTMSADNKYRNVDVLEEAGDAPSSPGNGDERSESIERQVAAKLVSELWQTGKVGDDSVEVKGLRKWLQVLLPCDGQPASPETQTPKQGTAKDKAQPSTQQQTPDLYDRTQTFRAAMVTLGNKTASAVTKWLADNGFPIAWPDLTEEAQDKALAIAQEKAQGKAQETPQMPLGG